MGFIYRTLGQDELIMMHGYEFVLHMKPLITFVDP